MAQVFGTTTTANKKWTFPSLLTERIKQISSLLLVPSTQEHCNNNAEPAGFYLALSLCSCHRLDKSTTLKIMAMWCWWAEDKKSTQICRTDSVQCYSDNIIALIANVPRGNLLLQSAQCNTDYFSCWLHISGIEISLAPMWHLMIADTSHNRVSLRDINNWDYEEEHTVPA